MTRSSYSGTHSADTSFKVVIHGSDQQEKAPAFGVEAKLCARRTSKVVQKQSPRELRGVHVGHNGLRHEEKGPQKTGTGYVYRVERDSRSMNIAQATREQRKSKHVHGTAARSVAYISPSARRSTGPWMPLVEQETGIEQAPKAVPWEPTHVRQRKLPVFNLRSSCRVLLSAAQSTSLNNENSVLFIEFSTSPINPVDSIFSFSRPIFVTSSESSLVAGTPHRSCIGTFEASRTSRLRGTSRSKSGQQQPISFEPFLLSPLWPFAQLDCGYRPQVGRCWGSKHPPSIIALVYLAIKSVPLYYCCM